MKILGVNTLSHDSSVCLFHDINNFEHLICKDRSSFLDPDIIQKAIDFKPDLISYYEKPWLKKQRQLFNGQWINAVTEPLPISYFEEIGLRGIPIEYQYHHASHAATGFYTSNFDSAAVVVIDAIGEYTTTSIWHASKDKEMKMLWHRNYPHSLGLFYSAFTKLIGFKPNAEEYKLYELSQSEKFPITYNRVEEYLDKNLHRGITDWYDLIDEDMKRDIATSVQLIFERETKKLFKLAKKLCGYPYEENLVIMGGCAMNKKVAEHARHWFKDIYSYPKPGDVSSSIGAAILAQTVDLVELAFP
jgi:carbamoyltransferase